MAMWRRRLTLRWRRLTHRQTQQTQRHAQETQHTRRRQKFYRPTTQSRAPPPLLIKSDPHFGKLLIRISEVRFASFLSGGVTTVDIVNPPDEKLEIAALSALLIKSDPCFGKLLIWISRKCFLFYCNLFTVLFMTFENFSKLMSLNMNQVWQSCAAMISWVGQRVELVVY